MSTKINGYEVTPNKQAQVAAMRAGVPTLMWGKPGIGKTSSTVDETTEWGYYSEVISGGNRDSIDFLGMPVTDEYTDEENVKRFSTEYAPLGWARRLNAAAKTHGKAALVLDEINENAQVMPAMLRILQERYVGDTKLGNHVALLAMANPPEISVSGNYLPQAAANRLMHLYVDDIPLDNWWRGMQLGFEALTVPSMEQIVPVTTDSERITAMSWVVGFTKAHNGSIQVPPTNEVEANGPWASRRSWHNAARVIQEMPHSEDFDSARLVAVAGCVGKGLAGEFLQWVRQVDLYDIEQVLADPSIVNWKDGNGRIDRLYVLVNGLVAYSASRNETSVWEAAMDVLTRGAEAGRVGLAWPGARELFNARPKDAKISSRTQKAFAEMLAEVGLITK